jgi:hypothetical protein
MSYVPRSAIARARGVAHRQKDFIPLIIKLTLQAPTPIGLV